MQLQGVPAHWSGQEQYQDAMQVNSNRIHCFCGCKDLYVTPATQRLQLDKHTDTYLEVFPYRAADDYAAAPIATTAASPVALLQGATETPAS